jgi:two-component system NtrC family sensor kinase
MTEGRFADAGVRVLFLLAVGMALAAGAFLALHQADARCAREAEARERALREAGDQQAATAEILGAIAASPSNLQTVFDAIARNAVSLCRGVSSAVFRVDGGMIHVAATQGFSGEAIEQLRVRYPLPPGDVSLSSQVIRDRKVVHVRDLLTDPDVPAGARESARLRGVRSQLVVPMLRDDEPVGAIGVTRTEPGQFPDTQVALLQTFAEQAVIAIENARLFQELQARNRELTEALEQQTATSEILSVISSSPSDLQPVLDTIASSAAHLCGATDAQIFRVDGDSVRRVASHGPMPAWERIGINRESATGRAVVDRRTIHVRDIEAEPDTTLAVGKAGQRKIGFRTVLATPLLREGVPLGAILIRRMEVRPFADNQIRLLETFAAQAVIAIENVRLFQELRTRNSELTETLDRQTATSEMLQVISRSPTEVQPVFDAIARSGRLLCSGKIGGVFRYEDGLIHLAAAHGMTDEALVQVRGRFPAVPGDATLVGRAIRDRDVVNVSDLDNDPGVTAPVRESARIQGVRSQLVVPMLRDNEPIGAVTVSRADTGQFSESHIALLRTFADQAVIAIENVRLFQELEARTGALARSVEELQALSEVGRAVSSTLDLPTVLATIVARAVQLSGTSGGGIYEYDEATQEIRLQASHRTEEELVEVLRARPVRLGEGATGQAALRRVPVEVTDTLGDQEYQVTPVLRSTLNRLGCGSSARSRGPDRVPRATRAGRGQAHPGYRGPRGKPPDHARPPDIRGLRDDRGPHRRGRRGRRRSRAPGPHPDGHPASGDRRLRDDPPDQGGTGAARDPDRRGYVLRALQRRPEGARRRLRRVRDQAVQPPCLLGKIREYLG